jgi:hypothetical protein
LLNDLAWEIYSFGSSSSGNKVDILICRNVTLRVGLHDAVNVTYCFFKTFIIISAQAWIVNRGAKKNYGYNNLII